MTTLSSSKGRSQKPLHEVHKIKKKNEEIHKTKLKVIEVNVHIYFKNLL